MTHNKWTPTYDPVLDAWVLKITYDRMLGGMTQIMGTKPNNTPGNKVRTFKTKQAAQDYLKTM